MPGTMLCTYIISINSHDDPKKGTIIFSFSQMKKEPKRAKEPANKIIQLLRGKGGTNI